jgi:CelD/BcsL family acetyltransferase involved in cellulose biosynthesis
MTIALNVSSAGVTRVGLTEALALGPAVWGSLEASAAASSPFMSWPWYRAWADAAPVDSAASEALVLRGGDGGVRAILPLMLRRVSFHRVPVRALTWAAGDMGCPDHLDVLAAPPPDSLVAAFVPCLEALPWELLILSNLAPAAETTRRLCESFAAHGYDVRRQKLWVCPYMELCDDWERYLGTLTPTRRQTVRRKERQLRREHAVTITDYEGDRVDEGLNHLFALHARRWEGGGGEGGAFTDAAVRRLHQRFAAELAARNQLWLTTLDIAGEPVAAWYGFTWGDTVYFYQSGRDPRWERQSVGLVLMATMIRRAIERGYRCFDFLRGDDPYKRQWTATQRFTEEITIFRPGWRGHLLRALDAVGQVRARFRRKTAAEAADA